MFEKTSNGQRFFIGKLGDASIRLVLEETETRDGAPIWRLLVQGPVP